MLDKDAQSKLDKEMARRKLSPAEWITVQEGSARLKVTTSAIRYMVRANGLLSQMVAGRRLVNAERLEHLRKCRAGEYELQLPPAPDPPQAPLELPKRTGFQVERCIWRDWDNDDIWIPSDRAMETLNVKLTQIHRLARRGKLRRRWADRVTNEPIVITRDSSVGALDSGRLPSQIRSLHNKYRAMFSLRDLQALIAEREKHNFTLRPNDPERPLRFPNYRKWNELPPEGDRLSIIGAAMFLGVGKRRISDLIRRGTLFAWQKEPGKSGSKVILSATQVRRYMNSWERTTCRTRWLKACDQGRNRKPPQRVVDDFRERNKLVEVTGRSLEKDHGEYYTLTQTARVLGVGRSRVRHLRAQGVLTGVHLGRRAKQEFNRSRWWFFKKTDVHDLKADHGHQRARKRYLKTRFPHIYGDDANRATYDQPKEPEYRPHEWNPKQPTHRNPFEELREGMRIW